MRRFIVLFIFLLIIACIIGVIFAIVKKSDSDTDPSFKNIFPISLLYPKETIDPQGGGGVGGDFSQQNEYTESTNEFDDGVIIRPISLSTEEVYGYWIERGTSSKEQGTSTQAQTKTTAFFLTKTGELKKNDGTGEFSLLSYASYGIPLVVKQNASGTLAAVRFDSGSTYLYSVTKNAWELLGNAISDFAFSPNGQSMLALEERGGETTLVRFDALTTSPRKTILLRFGGVDFRLEWPSADRAILSSVPSYFSEGIVTEINLQTRAFRVVTQGNGLGVLTSSQSPRLLVFRPETKAKTTALLYAPDGTKLNTYNRFLLHAKCGASLSNPVIWCGAPQLLPSGSFTFPDDYLKRALFTHDELVGIDLLTGDFFSVPFSSDSYVDMSFVIHAEDNVFFINRLDGKLYKLLVQT